MNDLILPPLLNSIKVASNPYQTAIEHVQRRKAGAGDLFWAPSETQARLAIVLEPEVDCSRTLEMVPLMMVALSDCLAVLLPPQVAVQFRDERFVIVNGAVVATIEMTIAGDHQNEDLQAIPDWSVVGLSLEMKWPEDAQDPGDQPDITVLAEEGWDDPDLQKFIETFARHFLSWMVSWNDDGFEAISRAWKFKAENEQTPDMSAILKQVQMCESKMSE